MTLRTLRYILTFILLTLTLGSASAQSRGSVKSSSKQKSGAVDSTKIIPRGITTWRIDPRFGSITPTEPDTVPHLFQQVNLTEGIYGNYQHTGNLASPRISRIYNGQQDFAMASQFIFERPYDMPLGSVFNHVYTNTKSPITNLTWLSQGNKTNGSDRLRANFATNVNKRTGLGAKVDYFYGRGYYQHQNNASVAAKLFGSFVGEKYMLHADYILDRTKNAENGGLTDDTYVLHPERYSTKYAPQDMPVYLSSAYNRLKINTLFLNHRYNLGYYELVDSVGEKLDLRAATAAEIQRIKADSLVTDPDSIAMLAAENIAKGPRRFVPVAAIVHTLQFDHNRRTYEDYRPGSGYYRDNFIAGHDTIVDQTRYVNLANTVALEMQEGFRRWVKTGMRLYGRHQFTRFSLPDQQRQLVGQTFNYITLGAMLMKEKGSVFHYDVLGEMRTTGKDWGEFNVEGNIRFDIPIRRDSIGIRVDGFIRNEQPAYYFRHYHAAGAWWDQDLHNVFRSRVEGTLSWRDTRLKVGFETIQNHTFFQELQSWDEVADPLGADRGKVKYGVTAMQADKNIQVLSAALSQNFKFGPVVWENELTFQHSSNDRALPLPKFNAWSNLYFHFYVAHVLRTDIGGDVRYFTPYYAPAYSPMIGMYVVQDAEHRTKVGNYPWVNVYANFHLKQARFYVMFSHVNCGAGGNYFLTPHYATERRCFRIGISWNFFN